MRIERDTGRFRTGVDGAVTDWRRVGAPAHTHRWASRPAAERSDVLRCAPWLGCGTEAGDMAVKRGRVGGLALLTIVIAIAAGFHYLAIFIDRQRFPWGYPD